MYSIEIYRDIAERWERLSDFDTKDKARALKTARLAASRNGAAYRVQQDNRTIEAFGTRHLPIGATP